MSIHWPLQRSVSKQRIRRRHDHDEAQDTSRASSLHNVLGNQQIQRLMKEGTLTAQHGQLTLQREPTEVADPTTVEHPAILTIEEKIAKLESDRSAIETGPGLYTNKMWTEMAPTEANAISRLGGEKGIEKKIAAALKKEVARRVKKKEAALTPDETAAWSETERKRLIDDQKSRLDPSNYQRYREGTQAQNVNVVDGIEEIRSLVNALNATDLGMDGPGIAELKAGYFVRLNRVSPYFQQMSNINYLPNNQSQDASWTRTCNLTSLAMAINAFGAGQGDFGGDVATLVKVAAAFDPKLDHIEKVQALRMPDFLQLVAIYSEYMKIASPTGDFNEIVKKARTNAAGRNTSGELLAEVAKLFGVKGTSKWDIPSAGAKLRNEKARAGDEKSAAAKKVAAKKKEIAPLEKKEKAKTISPEDALKLVALRSELVTLEADLGTKSAELKEYDDKTKKGEKLDAYEQEADITEIAFRDNVRKKILPLVSAGKQIMSNRPGHYVRLQEVTDTGIIVDDPADPGKNVPLTWKEANRIGHFWHYIVLEK